MGIFSLFSKPKSTGIFVPDRTGFKELTEEIKDRSINGMAKHLDYNQDQFYAYFGDFDQTYPVQHVIVEIFTKNIIYVLTGPTVLSVTKNQVDFFLRDFNLTEIFDSISTRDILVEGIKNKTLRIEFLSRVLDIKNPELNGIFNADSIGLYLYFNDGFLTDFQSSDGLNEWAKQWKSINPEFISRYESLARHYLGNDTRKIINEINLQAEAYANIPDAMRNQFIHLHEGEFDTINFYMLMVCHYKHNIKLDEFQELNHGRFTELTSLKSDVKKYSLGNFTYEFAVNGD